MRCLAALLLLMLLASAGSAETIWLRGRGDRVWIERDGEMREPRDDRKGFTRVATSPVPGVRAGRRAPRLARPSVVVVVGDDDWAPSPYAYRDAVAYDAYVPYPPRVRFGYGRHGHAGDFRFGRHRHFDRHFSRHRSHHRGRRDAVSGRRDSDAWRGERGPR